MRTGGLDIAQRAVATRPTRTRIAIITAAFGLMMFGNGLLLTLLGVRSTRAEFGGVVTGAVLGMYYVGFLIGARHAPALLRRFGVTYSLAGLFVVMALVTVAPIAAEVAWYWVVLRLVQGYAISAAYVVIEAFLNGAATNERRGALLGAYMVVTMATYGAGTYAIDIVGSDGAWPFVFGGLVTLAGALALIGTHGPLPAGEPVVHHGDLVAATAHDLSTTTAPTTTPVPPDSRLTLRQLFDLAPLGVVVGIFVGATNGAISGVSVFAERAGLSDARTGLFGLVGALGPLLVLYPMSTLSDRWSRRSVLAVCAIGSSALLVVNTTLAPTSPWTLVSHFLIGGLTVSQYTLTSAENNDRVRPDQMSSVGSHVILIYGIGALAGTLAASVATNEFVDGFWWVNVVGHLGVLAVVATAGRGRASTIRPANT
jgi:MFS family permease